MILANATRTQLEALNWLRIDPNTQSIVALLKETRQRILEQAMKVDQEKDFYRLQGRAAMMADLIEGVERASEVLKTLSRP